MIGKRPAPSPALDNFMKSNLSQWRREHKKEFLNSCHTKNKKIKCSSPIQGSSSNNSNYSDSLKPCYVPPNIPGNPQENSTLRGNAKKMHMRYSIYFFLISCLLFHMLLSFSLHVHFVGVNINLQSKFTVFLFLV